MPRDGGEGRTKGTRGAKAEQPATSVVILGDAGCEFQHVADALAACKEAGISQLSVSVRIAPGQVPYPLFSFAALVPWSFFANGLSQSSNSLVGSANLIKKGMVYSPSHGEMAFTVPLFDAFMRRAMPRFEP